VCSRERQMPTDCRSADFQMIGNPLLCPSVTVAQTLDALRPALCQPQKQHNRES